MLGLTITMLCAVTVDQEAEGRYGEDDGREAQSSSGRGELGLDIFIHVLYLLVKGITQW